MRWIGRLTKQRPGGAAEQQASARADTSPAADADSAAIAAVLKEHVVALSDGKLDDDIDLKAPLFDYGYVDSLSSVSLIEMIRERYAVDVSEVELVGRLNTLEALARFVAGKAAHRD